MSCEARQPPLRPKRSLIKGKQAKSAKSLKRKGPDPVLDACFSASGLCAHYHHGASACMLVSAPRVLAMPQERKQDKAEQACTQEHSWLFLLEPPQPLWKECLRMVWWPVKDIYTEYRQRAPWYVHDWNQGFTVGIRQVHPSRKALHLQEPLCCCVFSGNCLSQPHKAHLCRLTQIFPESWWTDSAYHGRVSALPGMVGIMPFCCSCPMLSHACRLGPAEWLCL